MSFYTPLINTVHAGAVMRGETIDVRHLNTLDRQGKSGVDARVLAATVKGAHSEDDTVVTIEVIDSTAQRLRGRLPSGLAVTIDGGSYALTAEVSIQSSVTSVDLAITPGLTGDLVGSEAVVLASYVQYSSVPAVEGALFTERDSQGQPAYQLYCVPRKNAGFDLDDLHGIEFWRGSTFLCRPTEHQGSTSAQWRVLGGATL